MSKIFCFVSLACFATNASRIFVATNLSPRPRCAAATGLTNGSTIAHTLSRARPPARSAHADGERQRARRARAEGLDGVGGQVVHRFVQRRGGALPFVFKAVFTICTCDPKLGAKQITHTNTQEERFLRGGAEIGTLAQVLSRQFDTDRLDGDNAHKLRPGNRETAVAERWCRLVSLPHTLYVSLVHHKYDADVGDFALQPKSVNYPERIDFGYPPYLRSRSRRD